MKLNQVLIWNNLPFLHIITHFNPIKSEYSPELPPFIAYLLQVQYYYFFFLETFQEISLHNLLDAICKRSKMSMK